MDQLHALARQASERLAGDQGAEITLFDATTGNAATVRTLRSAPMAGDLVEAALRHVYAIAPAFGLASTVREFAPDPTVQSTGSGASVVHLQQRYEGVPVFEAEMTVRFGPDRAIWETAGSVIAVESVVAGSGMPVQDAVRAAAQHVSQPALDEMDGRDQFGQPLAGQRRHLGLRSHPCGVVHELAGDTYCP